MTSKLLEGRTGTALAIAACAGLLAVAGPAEASEPSTYGTASAAKLAHPSRASRGDEAKSTKSAQSDKQADAKVKTDATKPKPQPIRLSKTGSHAAKPAPAKPKAEVKAAPAARAKSPKAVDAKAAKVAKAAKAKKAAKSAKSAKSAKPAKPAATKRVASHGKPAARRPAASAAKGATTSAKPAAKAEKTEKAEPITWFSAPKHLVFALPIAEAKLGKSPSIAPASSAGAGFTGEPFAALDFWGKPVGVAKGGQFESTSTGSWSPYGFRHVSGSMGARLFVPKARAGSLRAVSATGFTPTKAERASLLAAIRAAEASDAKADTGCAHARSTPGVVTFYRELGTGRARSAAGSHDAHDAPKPARFAVAGGACLRVMELVGKTWRSRGGVVAGDMGESRGQVARVSGVLDMDGDGVSEIVTEVKSTVHPKYEPDTVVVRFDAKRDAFRVAAHFVDAAP